MESLKLHGLPVHIPAGWDDFSVHRFAAPLDAEPVPARARVKTTGAPPAFRTNLLVARVAVPLSVMLDDAFTASNAEARANPTFQIVRGPLVAMHGDRRVAWQDTTSLEAGGALQIFQRHIATMPAPGSLVLLTITSARSDVAALSKQLGFELA